jgi:hypothetical protein
MAQDDEAARKARAEELRRQISGLTDRQADAGEETQSSPAEESQTKPDAGMSPRDFIHKRMQELDEPEK